MIDFVISLPILTYCRRKSNNFILIIVNWLTKIIYYKPLQITINALKLAKIILKVVI